MLIKCLSLNWQNYIKNNCETISSCKILLSVYDSLYITKVTQIQCLFASGHVPDSCVLPVLVRVAVPETGRRRRQHPGLRQEAGCVPTPGGHAHYSMSGTRT